MTDWPHVPESVTVDENANAGRNNAAATAIRYDARISTAQSMLVIRPVIVW